VKRHESEGKYQAAATGRACAPAAGGGRHCAGRKLWRIARAAGGARHRGGSWYLSASQPRRDQ
jgi:hypothetical protein